MSCRTLKMSPAVPRPQGIYLEPTNICTLKCAGCARTTFLAQWPKQWHNHSLDVDQVMRFLDIDLTDLPVLLSGNYGDPIYHPDLINLVQQLKQRGAHVRITTNGSYRNPEWWHALTSLLTPQDTVIFSIDGVPENFVRYRQNADWESMLQGIKICVDSAVKTTWKYIPFDFNQDHIDQARQISQDLGFDDFFIDPSKRFDDVATVHLQPARDLISPEYQDRVAWKQQSQGRVRPRCASGQEHFVTADGYYTPCCYVADHRWLYKTQFGRQRDQYHISNTRLSDLLARPDLEDFYQDLDQQPVCQFSCPG